MPLGLGWPELLIILVVALLLFGGSRLAGVGKGTGRAIREFKEETQSLRDDKAAKEAEAKAAADAAQQAAQQAAALPPAQPAPVQPVQPVQQAPVQPAPVQPAQPVQQPVDGTQQN